ncbi:RNA helicase [Malassezia psittaci]|uniref:RNA helicase n=1 Tax=Malassezia psittaci TaxID=1821823 RepID=A0AAF0JEW5_9BASI|nr:RNA helicase [Malassezia psittaci]
MSEARNVSSFSALGLSSSLVRALKALYITVPTAIQAATIPAILEGRDVIGGAETGSGKTLAFALPILHKLQSDMMGGYGLILTPTRELAVQLHEQFLAVGQGSRMGLKCALVLGGMDMMKQAIELAGERPHLIVATPGRLADLLQSGGRQEWGLERCKFVVLDEADRLLSPTFAKDLGYIFSILPPARMRQTLLFTATLTPEIERLTQKEPEPGKLPPLLRKIQTSTTMPASLTQQYVFVPSHVREPYLYYLLYHAPCGNPAPLPIDSTTNHNRDKHPKRRTIDSDLPGIPLTIIFVARCETAELLSRMLSELGVDNVSLHSLLTQTKRMENLQAFRSQSVPILISTDVGSRGLDIPDVKMVVNWDLPVAWEDYVHRVGRTARKKQKGWAVSFVTERDIQLVQNIEQKIEQKLIELELPEARVLEHLNEVGSAKRAASIALHDEHFGERRERNKKKARIANQETSSRKRSKTKVEE